MKPFGSKSKNFLDSQEFLEKFHFSFSISILRHFYFTFHSRSQNICSSLFILEMSEPDFHFTFHLSKKVREIFFTFTFRTSNINSPRTLKNTTENLEKFSPQKLFLEAKSLFPLCGGLSLRSWDSLSLTSPALPYRLIHSTTPSVSE